MESYDPTAGPQPDIWLALDEDHRITLVEEYHSAKGVELPNEMLHASIHVIVENQIALGIESVIGAAARLMRQGLDRHDAIHAIGAVLTEQIHGTLSSETDFDPGRYESRLKKLTAKRWKKGKW
ncbi:MAG: DUF1841 family protein [Gammaproteobacteria bacterium]